MRKALFITGVILLFLIAAIYLLIPSKLEVIVVLLPVKCNVEAADRSLRDTGNPAKWWGDAGATGDARAVRGAEMRWTGSIAEDGRCQDR